MCFSYTGVFCLSELTCLNYEYLMGAFSVSRDVIVVGGGLAGLTVANRATELGLSVIVLEQGEAVDYPCNSRFAGGIVHVAQKEPRAEPADIQAAIDALTGGEGATNISPVMANEASRALDWMRAQGAKFIKGGVLEFMRWVLAPPRPRRPGLDWKGRGPDVLLRTLTAKLESGGGRLERGARAIELIVEGGRVAGVQMECAGETSAMMARAVVIADGGFQGNPDLVQKYISPAPESLFTRGAGNGCGDGLRMAAAVGADLVGMDRFYGHLLGREAFNNEMLWPYPTVDAIAQVSVVVDEAGHRLFDEGQGGVYMANKVAALDNPMSMTVVFDDTVWTRLAADNRYPPCMNPSFVKEGGTVFEANDLAELAGLINVDPDGLAQTVSAFNTAVSSDAMGALTPLRATDKFQPVAIRKSPFHAIQLCAGITYTMGGVSIDEDSRVQSTDGAAIEGLYAAGSATGGIEGGPHAAYIGGLSKAVITGLRAAEHIAEN
jgi:fumarate reductase flavoprotein subunit